MKVLCTFSGKFGDILWSLPTVEQLGEALCDAADSMDCPMPKIDFGIMPQYKSLLSLLNAQSYIDKAFTIDNWIYTGSPHGDQPWEAPVPEGYDKVYHLTYRTHPSKNQPLIDFIAQQQGITLSNPIPFIEVKGYIAENENDGFYHLLQSIRNYPCVAYAFNESMQEIKKQFLGEVERRLEGIVKFIDVSKMPWIEAAWVIDNAIAFIGCRSSNYVLACGLGQRVFIFEPNVSRSAYGLFGTTFTCPYAKETQVSFVNIDQIRDELKEKVNAIATTVTR